ncbi:SusC/RagA family TonB-linked outer membrane protein [Pedobacter cryophilus]|uniref:SusC/RagA family TonB-linked outer membrane protein n=1 Tax=Pedobacter cryophilus TaxID=2571271 RepID=A0A4U1BUX5_9SPHI|nr:SusC/RagA family TonB-linked outer membrane protein [Pedobacter cryophilus]TKB96251.1 SusC/RagA family TonB-linked outer membrane protein [Pedobacter cryophilus]
MKRSLLKKLFLFILIALSAGLEIANAQEKFIIIKGKVVDKNDKLPIPGASVVELDKDKRTITGVTTDFNGNFSIRVSKPDHQLSVSFIGYKTFFSGGLNGRTEINIALETSFNELQGVTVTAKSEAPLTDLAISARNSTRATSTINAERIDQLSVTSIDQALQGRLTGVDFGTTSGDPGAGMAIRIRGTSSISGSAQPLIILDGMPYETEVPKDFNFGTADDQGYAQLLNIAPSDILDITVLKDAASTALWGGRAANGVLLINTKRGKMGKPAVNYNFKGALATQPASIPFLTGNQYSMLIPEEVMNATNLPLDFLGNNGQNKAFQYDPLDAYYYYNYSNNTDWIDLISQTGVTQDHNVSMSGGGEKTRYYASVGYLNQSGTTKGTDLTRITTKINLDYNVSSKLRFRTDLTYTHVNNNLNYTNSLRTTAFNKMPNMSPYEYDENGNITQVYFSPESNIQGRYSGTYNPLAMANEGSSQLFGERITPRFNLSYKILPDNKLTFTGDVVFDINNNKSKTFLPQIATGRPSSETTVNKASDSDGDSYSMQTKLNLVYTPISNEKQSLQNLISFQTSDSRTASFSAISSNTASSYLRDPSILSVTNGSGLGLNSAKAQSRSMGLVFQSQYQLLDRYIFSLNGRIDGNSKYGPDNRFGFFPGVSARWRVSGEPFMKKYNKFLDDLSIRLSYGSTPNAPGSNYAYFSRYTPFSWTYLGNSAVSRDNIALTQLRWETVVGKNLGFNLWMFNDRVKLDAEIYQNTTKDMYYSNLRIPNITGYSAVSMNIGTMNNDGWEIGINTLPVKTKNWVVDLSLNVSRNVNSIQSISEFYPRESVVGLPGLGNYKSYLIEGNPFGSYYGFRYKGVYKTAEDTKAKDANGAPIIGPNGQVKYMRYNYPVADYIFQAGDAIYEDINHDGNIDEADMVYLGNGLPKFNGGFGTDISYKGTWKLGAYFSYRYDFDVVNKAQITTTNMYGFNNQSTAILSRWRNPGDDTNMPRALYNDGYNWLGSDRYIEDASFLRLYSVTCTYIFGKSVLQKLNIKSGRLYVTGQNLYTWTNYTGQDPDINIVGDNSPFAYPQDNALTPPPRIFTLGLTLGF